MKARTSRSKSAADSLKDYGRGISGGLLFSLPLLYTMEVWWLGFLSSPRQLLAFLAVVLLLLAGYNGLSGFREDSDWIEIAVDSVDALGFGILTAAGVLWVLGRITLEMPFEIIAGKVVVEAGMVAIGISIGTAQLGADEEPDSASAGDEGGADEGSREDRRSSSIAAHQVILAFFGGAAFAANVAPTEEVFLIAAEMSFGRLLLLACLSVAVTGAILHFSEFAGSNVHSHAETPFQIATGIAATYAVALATAAGTLGFMGRFEGAPFALMAALTVVLAFPTVLGASAARLLLQAR